MLTPALHAMARKAMHLVVSPQRHVNAIHPRQHQATPGHRRWHSRLFPSLTRHSRLLLLLLLVTPSATTATTATATTTAATTAATA